MDNALLERVVEQAEFFNAPLWLHWFGEPLMNPKWFEQILIAKRKIPNVGISTNATLLRGANQERVLDSPLDTILIAIDGATKDVYERVRKSSHFTFEEVCDNAKQFLAKRKALGRTKPRVILSIIVMEATAPGLEDFKRCWLECGADEVRFKGFVNWGGSDSEVFDDLQLVSKRGELTSPRAHPCKFMWQSLVIAWDGRVVPCCFDYDAKVVLGDLKLQTLSEIWNGPAYVELRRAELAGRNHFELCANCSQAPGHPRFKNWPNERSNGSLEGSRTLEVAAADL
jgi:radical SAM protein with 4Fe4S-binding SPASM domain